MHRLMISLNSLAHDDNGDPVLAIRTLLERNLEDVLLNSSATSKLLKYASQTTADKPVIPIPYLRIVQRETARTLPVFQKKRISKITDSR